MTLQSSTILIVDDDADARLIMAAAMRKAGFKVLMATGGLEAMAIFSAEAKVPDLVMLDVEMPDMDGFAVCRLLRAKAGPLLPVVMVTGMDDVSSVESAYECGATDFIAKPVNWALIGHRVRHLMRNHMTMLALKSAEARITKLAYFDSLTGLPNRRTFIENVDSAVRQAGESSTRLAVLFIDLDRFKTINDTFGHAAGDLLLKEAAIRLDQGLRPAELSLRSTLQQTADVQRCDLARLGGDEFTALITEVKTPETVKFIAQRIGQLMRQPFLLEGQTVTLTASIGIAMFPEDGRDGAALLKHADTAMYHAKRSGRDNCQIYNTSFTREILQQAELESGLRLALDRGEFHVVYQPKVDIASGRVLSVEALIRWLHPKHGLISPEEFIPPAEQIGIIDQIGQWVLQTACAQAVIWAQAGLPISVAVNLSPLQISNRELPQHVFDVLAHTGLAPDQLELEVTEGALMQNTDQTLASLERLREHGVRLALDDFGTGYSSLAYLTRFPIDSIKIDRCFVNDLNETDGSTAIVRAVIAIARSLDMQVTAEGVETLQQAEALHLMGCDVLQGFYFSRPVPAEQIPAECAKTWQKSVVAPIAFHTPPPYKRAG